MSLHTCTNCANTFGVTPFEEQLRQKLAPTVMGEIMLFPVPKFCPYCRQQRRLTYRNERMLYARTCDMTGEAIISIYSPDKPYKVFGQEVWWGDTWDARDFGRTINFSRPFFPQMKELLLEVPRPNTVNMFSENSLYTNHSAYNKNCYMCVNTGWSEDCMYISNYSIKNKDCVDSLAIHECEQCYYSVNAVKCSFSSYLLECEHCVNCQFCFDLRGCNDCFGCYNLRQKRYYIYNKPYTKEEYEQEIKKFKPRTRAEYDKCFEEFKAMMAEKAVHKALTNYTCENSTGDYLTNCKNVYNAFYTFDSEDICYSYDTGEVKDSIDAYEPFKGELHYETHACNQGYRMIACSKCYENNDLKYCQYCWNSNNLFGCVGMKRNSYCILNKQYEKEEYENLMLQLIRHMLKTGEWGEFFPAADSPYGYNETVANDYYPLTKDQALAKGFIWSDFDAGAQDVSGKITTDQLPDTSEKITDELLQTAVVCKVSGRLFKFVEPELAFYRKNQLPLPHKHPDVRHMERFMMRNPRHLWQRTCTKCNKAIASTYEPGKPILNIYCEECYQKEIY